MNYSDPSPMAEQFAKELPADSVRMADVFALAKRFMGMNRDQIEMLLDRPTREHRIGAVSIMDVQPRRRSTPAITATWTFIRRSELDDTFAIAELLVDDLEHLDQTAVGGWVREAGIRDLGRLRAFLDAHAATMPRTTLRYAIEHLDANERRRYRTLYKT